MIDPLRDEDSALAAHVQRAIQTFRSAIAPPLPATLDAFLTARGLDLESDPLGNFTRTAQPVAHLPVWTARALRARGSTLPEGALGAAVEAAIFGYLCAQVQDDGLEDRLGPPCRWVLLAHALFARHQTALLSAAGADPGFWDRYLDRWLRYAGASAAFAGAGPARGTERAAAIDRAGPLLLPAAALLTRAAPADLSVQLEALASLVQRSTDAAQLFDDLLDAREDLRRGRQTFVVRAMGGEDGADGEGALRRRLYREGGVDLVTEEALAALARAGEAASTLGMRDAVESFTAAAAHLSARRRGFLDALDQALSPENRP